MAQWKEQVQNSQMWVDCQYVKYLLLFPKKNFLMLLKILKYIQEFPGGAADETSPASAGDMGSSHGVWEDSTFWGATKPMNCNYCSPEPLEPVLSNKRSHRNEKPVRCSEE